MTIFWISKNARRNSEIDSTQITSSSTALMYFSRHSAKNPPHIIKTSEEESSLTQGNEHLRSFYHIACSSQLHGGLKYCISSQNTSNIGIIPMPLIRGTTPSTTYGVKSARLLVLKIYMMRWTKTRSLYFIHFILSRKSQYCCTLRFIPIRRISS